METLRKREGVVQGPHSMSREIVCSFACVCRCCRGVDHQHDSFILKIQSEHASAPHQGNTHSARRVQLRGGFSQGPCKISCAFLKSLLTAQTGTQTTFVNISGEFQHFNQRCADAPDSSAKLVVGNNFRRGLCHLTLTIQSAATKPTKQHTRRNVPPDQPTASIHLFLLTTRDRINLSESPSRSELVYCPAATVSRPAASPIPAGAPEPSIASPPLLNAMSRDGLLP